MRPGLDWEGVDCGGVGLMGNFDRCDTPDYFYWSTFFPGIGRRMIGASLQDSLAPTEALWHGPGAVIAERTRNSAAYPGHCTLGSEIKHLEMQNVSSV